MNTMHDEFPGATPRLCVDSVDAIVPFYVQVFGAHELRRATGPDGRVWHCELLMLHGRLLIVDEFPEAGNLSPRTLGDTPVTLHAYVEDVDVMFAAALTAGATGVREPLAAFWGDRYAEFIDPAGHRWSVATPTEDQAPAEQDANAMSWIETHEESIGRNE